MVREVTPLPEGDDPKGEIKAMNAKEKVYGHLGFRGGWIGGRDWQASQQVSQEPVGYISDRDLKRLNTYKGIIWPSINELAIIPLYTSPVELNSKPKRLVRHKKTGRVYEVLGRFSLKDVHEDVDAITVTVYRSVETGEGWAEPFVRFEDGRFENISSKHFKEY